MCWYAPGTTRRRKKLQGNLSAEKNRIQKVLEVANVKIGNIVSDVFGVSGQAMVSALVSAATMERPMPHQGIFLLPRK